MKSFNRLDNGLGSNTSVSLMGSSLFFILELAFDSFSWFSWDIVRHFTRDKLEDFDSFLHLFRIETGEAASNTSSAFLFALIALMSLLDVPALLIF